MPPRTRVDKLVWLRERVEDGALAALARAHADVERARERVACAMDAARADTRGVGRVELWLLDDDGHRRALQLLRSAQGDAQQAATREAAARDGFSAAQRDTEAVRRIQGRRRAELEADAQRRERRTLDEIATLRFNASR